MSQTIRIDELNLLDYEEWFGEMGISEGRKKARIQMAEDMDDVFIYVFSLMDSDFKHDKEPDRYYYYNSLQTRLDDVLQSLGYDLVADYPEYATYIEDLAEQIVDTTIDNAKKAIASENKSDKPEERPEYWFSENRARNVSADQANAILNGTEHQDAVKSGKKKHIWNSLLDGKERHTHHEAHGQKIPIDKWFKVGHCEMPYPRYFLAPPSEVVNCRCWEEYE